MKTKKILITTLSIFLLLIACTNEENSENLDKNNLENSAKIEKKSEIVTIKTHIESDEIGNPTGLIIGTREEFINFNNSNEPVFVKREENSNEFHFIRRDDGGELDYDELFKLCEFRMRSIFDYVKPYLQAEANRTCKRVTYCIGCDEIGYYVMFFVDPSVPCEIEPEELPKDEY